ncbi:hypothetical protein E6C27_scaffold242G002240 [Cucumis melo var. makuwa]|uniref:Uncharacterized protein n=1 Tax=Cucumis melo var. makuwa TaxID=1194695 RepID=A0A5A7UWE3_CUCMM|nr:hypothetical protein E6C27_scaffold242G002240 [Cucumis melo var. makuwa]
MGNKTASTLPKIEQEIQNIDTDNSKPWMPFGSTCLSPAQRIQNRINALEDRKKALLQEYKDLIVHDLTPQPEVLVQVVKDTFLDRVLAVCVLPPSCFGVSSIGPISSASSCFLSYEMIMLYLI